MINAEFEVLLVEDNPDHAQLIMATIRKVRKGRYHVWLSGSAESAIKFFDTMRFNLIISDHRLPGKSGLELLEWMNEHNIETPLIMLTGGGDEKIAVKAMQEGAYNYVVKDENYLQTLPHVIDETLLKFLSNQEKARLEREIREKNAALEKANRELKKLDQLKSDFIASVSHEIRTPLNAVKESISLILDGIADPKQEKGKQILEIGKRNIDRLTTMIGDILDFSKLESGKLNLHLDQFQIQKLADEIAINFDGLAQKKHIKIAVHSEEGIPSVYIDADRIIQVLTNLVNNAIKFTPESGRITIRCEKLDNMVKVSVEDTGPGIPREDLGRIFEKFEQSEHANVQKGHRGTGLGLTICRELVKLHHGRIWVESELGKGSQFLFTLPTSRQVYDEQSASFSNSTERVKT